VSMYFSNSVKRGARRGMKMRVFYWVTAGTFAMLIGAAVSPAPMWRAVLIGAPLALAFGLMTDPFLAHMRRDRSENEKGSDQE
jgi:predicted outer membrane lipoprotein